VTDLNEVQTAIAGHKCCNLFAVLNKLNTDALADGRVWLLSFHSTATQQSVSPFNSHWHWASLCYTCFQLSILVQNYGLLPMTYVT